MRVENIYSNSNYTAISLKTPQLDFQIWNQGPGGAGYGGSNSVNFYQGAATGPYAFFHGTSERMRITTTGEVAIGKTTAYNNYASGSTKTKFAVVTQPNVEGSFHETAHFAAGGDDGDTGAIVRIGQHENDRGLVIRAGQASSDRAIARFGLRNSGAVDTDVLTLFQDGSDYRVGIGENNPDSKLEINGSYNQHGLKVTSGASGYQDPLIIRRSTGGDTFRAVSYTHLTLPTKA